MEINKLQWDSGFFGLNVGEVTIDKPEIITANDSWDVVYTKQEREFDFSISGFQETLKETRVIYYKNLEGNPIVTVDDIIDYDQKPIDAQDLYNLAYISGSHSRFLLDVRFGKEKFRDLYRLWVDNSINKNFAEKIFYAEENGVPAGFVTLQNKNGQAYVGLIAVDTTIQNKGIGKSLLMKCEHYCIQNNFKTLNIPTQKENVLACRFYEKNGYEISEAHIIKHFWKIS